MLYLPHQWLQGLQGLLSLYFFRFVVHSFWKWCLYKPTNTTLKCLALCGHHLFPNAMDNPPVNVRLLTLTTNTALPLLILWSMSSLFSTSVPPPHRRNLSCTVCFFTFVQHRLECLNHSLNKIYFSATLLK